MGDAGAGEAGMSRTSMGDDQEVVVVHRSPAQRKGFAQIPHAVLTDPTLSDGAVRLYGILLSYAFQGESFKCGQAKMGRDLGKDDRTIRRLLKDLHERGLVTPVRQGQRMVNIYILEDAYALYDSERPQPRKRARTEVLTKAKPIATQDRPDIFVRSESDRTKMSGHIGQKSPVMQDKNVLLLKTPNKNLDKIRISTSSFPEQKDPEKNAAPWPFDLLSDTEQAPWLEQAETELRENFGLAAWLKTKEKARTSLRTQRAGNLYSAAKRAQGSCPIR